MTQKWKQIIKTKILLVGPSYGSIFSFKVFSSSSRLALLPQVEQGVFIFHFIIPLTLTSKF